MDDRQNIESLMRRAKRLFFVGIGGISMSSLAFMCRALGYTVAGSDRAVSAMTKKLESSGIPVASDHRGENIRGFDAVVYTGAVTMENPELAAARESGIPLIYRTELLAFLMRPYTHRIGVAGMHGKSTATAMLSHLLLAAEKDPTVMIGAETDELNGAYRLGGRGVFLFEACEYKDSFLRLAPSISVLLNIDLDHTDYFTGGLTQICDSFARYAALPYTGDAAMMRTVANADDENVCRVTRGLPGLVTFGIKADADYRARNIGMQDGRAHFDLFRGDRLLTPVSLGVFGSHHIYNALAAAAVADLLGISPQEIGAALSSFAGLHRRFEFQGEIGGARVYLDYAHHPRELAATIRTAREMTQGRLRCFFEPHTYSRTDALFDAFAESLALADEVSVLPIYAAREQNTSGVSAEALARAAGGSFCPNYDAAAAQIRASAQKGDTVLILGAGTVERVAKLLFSE